MRQPLTTLILAAAAGIFCVGTIGFAGYAWHCRNRATDAEKSLEILRARHPTTVVTRPAAATAPVIVDAAGDDARLLARIRELEAQLAESDGQPSPRERGTARSGDDANNGNRRRRGDNERRPDFGRDMEELARTDPERYAEIQAQRNAFRERMERAMTDRADFFRNRDTSTLAPVVRDAYAQINTLLQSVGEYGNLMQSGDLGDDERRDLMGAMRDAQRQLEPLLEVARQTEFRSLAEDLGYDATGVQEFTDFITSVITVTTPQGMRMRGPGGPPPSAPQQ